MRGECCILAEENLLTRRAGCREALPGVISAHLLYDGGNLMVPGQKRPNCKSTSQGDAMTLIRLKSVLVVLVFLSLSAASSWAQMPTSRDADAAGIRQSVAAFTTAWNNHD